MISGTKAQNVIVIAMVILGLFSGINLASSSIDYSGSYLIASYLHVELEEIRLTNYDSMDSDQDFGLYMDFNFQAPTTLAGEAKLDFMKAAVYLNGDLINYATFRKNVPVELQNMTSGYNATFTIAGSITNIIDKWVFYNATADNEWVFSVTLTYFYDVFDSGGDPFRVLSFAYTYVPE